MTADDLIPLERKYIELSYSDSDSALLRQFCQENNFDLSVRWDGSTQDPSLFDFHTTMWYTQSEHRIKNMKMPCYIPVKPVTFSLFGDTHSVLVIELVSDELQKIREKIGNHYGLVDTRPFYRPHITVSYLWEGKLPPDRLLEYFEQPLIASQIAIKTQKSS